MLLKELGRAYSLISKSKEEGNVYTNRRNIYTCSNGICFRDGRIFCRARHGNVQAPAKANNENWNRYWNISCHHATVGNPCREISV